MYCPSCRGEFRAGITRCANCEVDLVAEAPDLDPYASPESMAALLAEAELRPVLLGTYEPARQAQGLLAGARIASVVAPEEDDDMQPGLHARFVLLVAEEDVGRARGFFEARFAAGVANEGLQLKDPESQEVDAEGALPCPACDTPVPADQAECPECGLFVGVAEELSQGDDDSDEDG